MYDFMLLNIQMSIMGIVIGWPSSTLQIRQVLLFHLSMFRTNSLVNWSRCCTLASFIEKARGVTSSLWGGLIVSLVIGLCAWPFVEGSHCWSVCFFDNLLNDFIVDRLDYNLGCICKSNLRFNILQVIDFMFCVSWASQLEHVESYWFMFYVPWID